MKTIAQRVGGLLAGCLLLWANSADAAAGKGQPVTLLLIPAHYTTVQIAMDIYQHYPTVLMTYQPGPELDDDPVLHAWSGREWLFISCDDYVAGRFVRVPPDRAVLVGPENEMPSMLADGPLWTPLVVKVPAVKSAELLNALGRVFAFDSYMWKWFALRYKLELVDVAAPMRHLSWYDGSFVEKAMPDGTIQKVYVPPAGSVEYDSDITLLNVESKTRPTYDIPLKAEPPRVAESLEIEVEEIEPGEYEAIEQDEVQIKKTTPDGRTTITETGIYKGAQRFKATSATPDRKAGEVPPAEIEELPAPQPSQSPAVTPPKESSVFFEYTEEDMKAMRRTK